MIKQQLCRKSATGFQTLAVSSALRESAWMSLLEQPSPYEDAPGEHADFQYPLGTARQLIAVCPGKRRYRKCVPAQGIAVAKVRFQFAANCSNPHQMQPG